MRTQTQPRTKQKFQELRQDLMEKMDEMKLYYDEMNETKRKRVKTAVGAALAAMTVAIMAAQKTKKRSR